MTRGPRPRVVMIDNYDSFTHNLVHLLEHQGAEVRVFFNDAIDAHEIARLAPTHLVISPGPGSPNESGVSVQAILQSTVPVLGVCLGHQAIAAAFGGRVERAPFPVHGRAEAISHDGSALFQSVAQGFLAARYHSLHVAADSLPNEIVVTAWSSKRLVMALQHTTRPIFGVQFHPESVLTTMGARLIRNFLQMRS